MGADDLLREILLMVSRGEYRLTLHARCRMAERNIFKLRRIEYEDLMKKWTEDIDNLVGLPYIRFLNVPMKESSYGPVIDLPAGALERLAAIAVVEERIPLRGREVKFLRKVLGLSLEKFAHLLGLSSGTVFHWEKSQDVRLAPVNEAAVRALMAEKLEVDIPAHFSQLIGDQDRPIEVKAS